MTDMEFAHTSDESRRGLQFPNNTIADDTPIITVDLELDTYNQWSVPSPSHCPWPSCGALLGPHRVQLGWNPGHKLRSYRCATCERTWCLAGPEDPRSRPVGDYGADAGKD